MESILEFKNLKKSFGSVEALKDLNLSIKKGEVHGIVGANGSGKTTLLNIIGGSKIISETSGYTGDILINGKRVFIDSPEKSISYGIGMVHQELSLINTMSVASNIKLTRENSIKTTEKFLGKDFAYIDEKKDRGQVEQLLNDLGLDLESRKKVLNLPINLKQFLELAREIDKDNLKVLLLDEATSSLNKEDAEKFIEIVKNIKKKKNLSIIFISHRLNEVMDLCDRITVLRDGQLIKTYEKQEFNVENIALDMIGKEVKKIERKRNQKDFKEKILEFKEVYIKDGYREYENLSLDIYKNEILGITSLAGHGKNIFGYGLMGLYATKGKIVYEGKEISKWDTHHLIKEGIVTLPEERKEMGLLLNNSIEDNIVFTACQSKNKFLKNGFFKNLSLVDKKAQQVYTKGAIEQLNIKCQDMNQSVKELSGGNQQKVIMGRALCAEPKVLFVGEPTRGIDVYSKEIILKLLVNVNEQNNTTIVISSSEVEELMRICDRIAVMYEGKIVKIFSKFDEKEIGLAIYGKGSAEDEEV